LNEHKNLGLLYAILVASHNLIYLSKDTVAVNPLISNKFTVAL